MIKLVYKSWRVNTYNKPAMERKHHCKNKIKQQKNQNYLLKLKEKQGKVLILSDICLIMACKQETMGSPSEFHCSYVLPASLWADKKGNSRVSYLILNLSCLFRVKVMTSESASYFILAIGQWIIISSEESFNFVSTQFPCSNIVRQCHWHWNRKMLRCPMLNNSVLLWVIRSLDTFDQELWLFSKF